MLSSIRLATALLLLLAIGTIGLVHASGRRLVASDVVKIQVFGQPEFSTETRIDPDGSISYFQLKRVQAAGLTEDELAERIKQGLIKGGYLRNPVVTVSTSEAGVYYLSGYVNKPGLYPLTRQMTVEQAIAAGGGVSEKGMLHFIKLKRRGSDGQMMEKDVKLDDDVEPNDVIYVPERWF